MFIGLRRSLAGVAFEASVSFALTPASIISRALVAYPSSYQRGIKNAHTAALRTSEEHEKKIRTFSYFR